MSEKLYATTSCCGTFSTTCTCPAPAPQATGSNQLHKTIKALTPHTLPHFPSLLQEKRPHPSRRDPEKKHSYVGVLFTGLDRNHLRGSLHRCDILAAAVTMRHRTQRRHGLRLAAAGCKPYRTCNGKNESGGFHKKKMSYEVIAHSKANLGRVVNT